MTAAWCFYHSRLVIPCRAFELTWSFSLTFKNCDFLKFLEENLSQILCSFFIFDGNFFCSKDTINPFLQNLQKKEEKHFCQICLSQRNIFTQITNIHLPKKAQYWPTLSSSFKASCNWFTNFHEMNFTLPWCLIFYFLRPEWLENHPLLWMQSSRKLIVQPARSRIWQGHRSHL